MINNDFEGAFPCFFPYRSELGGIDNGGEVNVDFGELRTKRCHITIGISVSTKLFLLLYFGYLNIDKLYIQMYRKKKIPLMFKVTLQKLD